MVSRNDSMLVTGGNSRSFDPKPQKAVEERKLINRENKAKLQPGAQLILDDIAKEKAKVSHITELNNPQFMYDEYIKADLLARHRYFTYLDQLEGRMKIILGQDNER